MTDQFIADALAAFDAAAAILHLAIDPAVADLALGQVMGESNFGRSGTLGGNDWGAFQAGSTTAGKPNWIAAFQSKYAKGPPGVGGIAHRDSAPPSGSKAGYSYVAFYRVYPSQLIAAEDWLGNMAGRMGLAGTGAPADADSYAAQAYRIGYFQGTSADAQEDIDAYAHLVGSNGAAVSRVRASGVKGRDPATIDFPAIVPWYQRLSAGIAPKSATPAQMIAAAQQAFPKGDAQGDAFALAKTNGLAWIVGPPPGYTAAGVRGWSTPKKIGVGGALAGALGAAWWLL